MIIAGIMNFQPLARAMGRRCGQLLKTMKETGEMQNGARGTGSNQYRQVVESTETTPPKTLTDMGISYDQSSKYQKLALIQGSAIVTSAEYRFKFSVRRFQLPVVVQQLMHLFKCLAVFPMAFTQ